jgi:polyphosphate kinase 2 (PPK2 family)
MLIGRETCPPPGASESKKEIKILKQRLAELQRLYREKGTPIIIVMSGPSASGKGSIVSQLLSELDPRSFKLHTVPVRQPMISVFHF